MRYLALATDYDGTLATHGTVEEAAIEALGRLRASGRRLLMVTGRELEDLGGVFPHLDLFDLVVAENGALLYWPATREERVLADRPPEAFIQRLRERGVPLSVGRAIVATVVPHEVEVLEAIRDFGLELQVTFNKGAVMVLPSGVNKCTGLQVALRDMGLSDHNVVGIGDAENDHAFLATCECGVAVANALPSLKQRADLVTPSRHGTGVAELIDKLVSDDLAEVADRLQRHTILVGTSAEEQEVRLEPYGATVLVTGPSGSGKSTFTNAFLERLGEQCYQFCLVDPEGDYETFEGAVRLGDARNAPPVEEVLSLLQRPDQNVIVNLLGLKLQDRPGFFAALLPRLQELRVRSGRPHWLVIDEAHHLLPAELAPTAQPLTLGFGGVLFITVHPDLMAPAALSTVDTVVAVGRAPDHALRAVTDALGLPPPAAPSPCSPPSDGEALVWSRRDAASSTRVRIAPARVEHRRHQRKYAQAELSQDESFYFRGPESKLNLRAQNLALFLQMAEGVDDETWLYHLRRGDYSEWLRRSIKDDDLANEVARIEHDAAHAAQQGRDRIAAAIEQRYTAAATPGPSGIVSPAPSEVVSPAPAPSGRGSG